jgi:hypothetical protein
MNLGTRRAAVAMVGAVGVWIGAITAVASAPVPSDTTGCTPGARCIRVTEAGRPSASGGFVAQCRGQFPDFIASANAIPPGSTGQRFTPELIENATTSGPTSARPWRAFDPRIPAERLQYVLALRNYAFSSRPLRALTPQLTTGSAYRDPAGGTVPQGQRDQRWYPAPRMIYGSPGDFSVREPAYGMTLERTVRSGELAGNTAPFRNYAVAYYDRRGARTYQRVWAGSPPGRDVADLTQMVTEPDSLVFKLLFSAAPASVFPVDILQNSLTVNILPNNSTQEAEVRLLQVDIAVRDERAGVTGWYFATYVYDKDVAHTSVWRRMVPLGLMWGNDPSGPPLTETWLNPAAPAYARAHLGVDGRLNGPVDNPASACMSCHSTGQVPAVARMVADGACAPLQAQWFRNLAGTDAFGRFTREPSACVTLPPPVPPPVATDYSLQLAITVNRSQMQAATFNPCTWDTDAPPSVTPAPPGGPTEDVAAGAGEAAALAPAETESGAPVPVYEIRR